MGQDAAKEGDDVSGTDIHLVKIPTPAGEVPIPMPFPFAGKIDGGLSSDVNYDGKPAAIMGSTAKATSDHIPTGSGFLIEPKNEATCFIGSTTVFVNGKAAMRNGDMALTCNDPVDLPMGTIAAQSCTVKIG